MYIRYITHYTKLLGAKRLPLASSGILRWVPSQSGAFWLCLQRQKYTFFDSVAVYFYWSWETSQATDGSLPWGRSPSRRESRRRRAGSWSDRRSTTSSPYPLQQRWQWELGQRKRPYESLRSRRRPCSAVEVLSSGSRLVEGGLGLPICCLSGEACRIFWA